LLLDDRLHIFEGDIIEEISMLAASRHFVETSDEMSEAEENSKDFMSPIWPNSQIPYIFDQFLSK